MNMSPICFQLVTFASPVFSDKDRILLTPQIENIIFLLISSICVKQKILLSFVITACEKSHENPIFLYPSLLIFISIVSVLAQRRRAKLKALDRADRVKRTDRHSPIPDVSCLIKWHFTEVLPLRKNDARSAVVTSTSHTLHVCVTSQPLARLCLCPAPHHGADAWRKNNRHAMEI